jgi:amino acid adenylation domain-containing protein
VPLDPSYPADRLAFMLADAQVPVLLTQERLLATIDLEPTGALAPRVFCLDAQWEETAGESGDDPAVRGTVDNLAYVIYTSGSTGRPKGVMIPHRGASNHMLWMLSSFPLGPEDRVLQRTPISFDASVWELWAPLLAGARLVLARPGGHGDPAYLAREIAARQITVLQLVPSLLTALMEEPGLAACASLRNVFCGGEALPAELPRRLRSLLDARLHNLYGPTEATIDATSHTCAEVEEERLVPIGRPVANTSALVLDAHLAAVPSGVPGELYLGGVQLARGYLGRPELTAERFVPDPFAAPGNEGARLYRTGDQVRCLPGGEIAYLGRRDHQVKMRGFRIELGEIESALTSLAGVREAVVTMREDLPGDQRLVAYVTGEVAADALRRQLRERLPEFMVPAAFVGLEALPLTPNGKLDRKALPAPDRGPAPGLVAPRNPAEEILAEIWAELLGFERVGVHDNFFERGGHSLLAVRLMAGIEKRFGKTLPLAVLFTAPTVESLAALLSQSASPSGHQERRSPLVAIKPRGERPPFFVVHPVGGNVLCYLDLAHHLAPEQPLYALQTPDDFGAGSGGGRRLRVSLEEMAACYVRELRRVQPESPYRLGGWSVGGLVAFEMARQLAAEGHAPDLVALIDTLPPAAALPASDDELVAWFAEDLARLLGHEVGISPAELRPLPAQEKLGHVVRLGHAAGLLPEDFGLAQIEPLFMTFAANLQASRSYSPGPYSGSLALWLSEQTASAHASQLAGWSRLALGGIETSTLPGDHYSVLRRPQVERLARELTAHLAVTAPCPIS